MNAIHQISLKLQMGIHPAVPIQPEVLRAMWRQLSLERIEALRAKAVRAGQTSDRIFRRPDCRTG